MADVTFVDAASREFLRVRRWYAKKAGEATAIDFVNEVNDSIRRIAGDTTSGTEFRTNYRWIRLHRFPYLIYYRQIDDKTAIVMAIAHERRKPDYWLKRRQ